MFGKQSVENLPRQLSAVLTLQWVVDENQKLRFLVERGRQAYRFDAIVDLRAGAKLLVGDKRTFQSGLTVSKLSAMMT